MAHADELVDRLDDGGLHAYTGGAPLALQALRARYARQTVGHSPDGTRGWLNWVLRHRRDGGALGTMQTTLDRQDGGLVAELAWVVVASYQRHGYATEAATAVTGWLAEQGVGLVTAYIHPRHDASMTVAGRLGLQPTATVRDGEIRWELRVP